MKILISLIIIALFSGCGVTTQALNDRQVSTCGRWRGDMSLSSIGIGPGSAAIEGYTVTGGADLESCIKHMQGK